jgi:hypothetical protein
VLDIILERVIHTFVVRGKDLKDLEEVYYI